VLSLDPLPLFTLGAIHGYFFNEFVLSLDPLPLFTLGLLLILAVVYATEHSDHLRLCSTFRDGNGEKK